MLKSENYPPFKGTGRTFLSPWTVVITSSIVIHRVVDLASNGMGHMYVIVCLSPSYWRIACTEVYRAICSTSYPLHGHCCYDIQSLTHAWLSYYSFHKSHHAAAARPVHACCLSGVTWFGLRVLYVYCFHFMIPQYGFSFVDPFELPYA